MMTAPQVFDYIAELMPKPMQQQVTGVTAAADQGNTSIHWENPQALDVASILHDLSSY